MVRCLYKEVSTGNREAVLSVEPAHHPIGQQIIGPFEDVNELTEVVSYDPTPALLQDGTIAKGGTVCVKSNRQSPQSA